MIKFFVFAFFSFNLVTYAQENIGLFFNPTLDIANIDSYWFNYSVGIKGKFHLKNKLSLRASIGYEHNIFDLSKIIRFEGSPNYMDVKLIKSECHLRFDYLTKENKISFYSFIGPTINTSLIEKSDFGIYWGGIYENRKVRLYDALLTGGLGLGIPLIGRLLIEIEPSCAISVWTNKTAAASVYNPRLGLNVAMTYKTKK